jgi:hypothetical protein
LQFGCHGCLPQPRQPSSTMPGLRLLSPAVAQPAPGTRPARAGGMPQPLYCCTHVLYSRHTHWLWLHSHTAAAALSRPWPSPPQHTHWELHVVLGAAALSRPWSCRAHVVYSRHSLMVAAQPHSWTALSRPWSCLAHSAPRSCCPTPSCPPRPRRGGGAGREGPPPSARSVVSRPMQPPPVNRPCCGRTAACPA